MRDLRDATVLITGASRGLGVDMARAFCEAGCKIALAARSQTELAAVAETLGGGIVSRRVLAVPADVGDEAAREALVRAVEARLGSIDILVNNAGIECVCDFEEMPAEVIEQIIRVNVTGLVLLTRLVVPGMIQRRRGHILNIASVAGLMAVPHNAVYSASKHAVVGLSRSLRIELADHGIGVSALCPGFVEGGMFLRWGRRPPAFAGLVSAAAVAHAAVDCVRRNRGEVVVNPGLGKIADWFQAMAPDFSARMLGWTGVVDFLREQARRNARGGDSAE
ncbi:MAG: SDR family oxidoreductase [Candidatus Schekmanbacteria bacterium]|nr:SDR family oxidoreductase [Candidatus Schekmanbacteria bacterium]